MTDFTSNDIIYEIDNNLFFDPENQQLITKGAKVELGHNEAALLILLIESNLEIVTRETILERVWKGRGLVVDETSISQTVSQLRRHLTDDAKEQRIIKTIPKVGYCITKTCLIKQHLKSEINKKNVFDRSVYLYAVSLFFSMTCLLGTYLAISSENSHAPKLINNKNLSTGKLTVQQSPNLKIPKNLKPLITKCLLKLEAKSGFSQGRVVINVTRESGALSLSLIKKESSRTFTTVINPSIKLIENICQQ